MKKLNFICAFYSFIGLNIVPCSSTQEVLSPTQAGISKTDLLSTLNNVEDILVSLMMLQQNLVIITHNYVDKIFDITDGQTSTDQKISGLKDLATGSKTDLTKLLGPDGFGKYSDSMKNLLKPLAKKSSLLKYLI
ncbi:MAG: hypothetical protein U5K51_00810 [Flavobacteriaceae bacterium]|nr:hypothetical protein [Flavobacteriaceae bacterium]